MTPHDILCINGASAALMVSPLPFMGPVGAVRIARIDDDFVVNPSLEALEESTLDLVVVGTSDALTMIEAGADQVPEETLLEALEVAHVEIRKICEVLEGLRWRSRASRSGSILNSPPSSRARTGTRFALRSRRSDFVEAAAAVDALVAEHTPEITMDTTEDDIVRSMQVPGELRGDPREGAHGGRGGVAP